MQSKKLLYGWMFLWLLAAICGLFFIDTTGDNGDGIMHYFFARYAHLHPENFLDPWAKTGFTLLAWPFAQFGLKGMMLMNIFFTLINMWLVFKVAEKLGIKNPLVASVVMSLSTSYFVLMYSGLTEHAFSFILMLGIYWLAHHRWVAGTLILSTLPFFRQEGYIILLSLVPFYFVENKIKMIPLLASAFFMVAMAGAIKYSDVFWIIHSNPYSNKAPYGSGSFFTFFNYLYYHHGLINLCFFVAGVVVVLFFPKTSSGGNRYATILLIGFPFLAFFMTHVIFWYWGLFHSMGLGRVLNCVVPLFAIIGAIGFSKLVALVPNRWSTVAIVFLLALILVFPFVPSPSNINFKKDFTKKDFDVKIEEACTYTQINYPNRYIYFGQPLIPFLLNKDPFDKTVCSELIHLGDENPKQGALLFWDRGFTQNNSGISEEGILSDQRLIKLLDIDLEENNNRIMVFEVK